ncbi:hypothetical protein, partial [Flavobacterium sp.]|uniref:hypothetical protein n=1 Tax=Flavobacterium sp. TaxID=239 RepID=UPI002618C433
MKNFTLKLLFILLFATTLQAQNLLANGDFESGGVGVGFNINGTGYNFVASPTGTTAAGDYSFGVNPQPYNTTNFITSGDHTSGTGKMMLFDGSSDGGNPSFWKAGNSGGGICGLTVGATYTFRYWVRSISTNVTGPATQADIRVVFNNANVLTSPASTLAPLTTAGWEQRTYTFTPTNACVNIELRNFNTSFVGNDFAVDDLALLPPPKPLAVLFSAVSPYCATPATGSITVYGSGGTAPYTNYTISGSVNQNSTTGVFTNIPVGTYTVSVTDTAGNTVSQNNVVLAPAANPLTVSPNTTICTGSTATLSANGGLSYSWTATPADASLTTPTSATPVVAPTTTTTYTVTASANVTRNLVYNGDFSLGNLGFNTDYTYVASNAAGAQGMYGIVSNPSTWFPTFSTCPDHTTGTGSMMLFDGSNLNGGNDRLWTQTIPVQPGQTYTFSYWIQSVVASSPAIVQTFINGVSQGLVNAPAVATCGNWTQVTYTWNSGVSTSAVIALFNNNLSTAGNDFAIDDISFSTNVTCNASQSVTITVNTLSITVPSNQVYCHGVTVPLQQFTSNQTGTSITWTNSNPNIAIGASGQGNINSFLINNSTTIPQTTTITVTGSLDGCTNDVKTYTITVNPPPGVMVNNVVKCSGDNTPATMTATPTYPGTYSYAWTVPVGVPAPGNVASFTTTVPGNYSVTITNTATGCVASSAPGIFSFDLNCCINDITLSTNNQTFCNDTSCTVLNANYINAYDTTSYTVSSIPYAPLNPLGNLATALCTQDDRFSDPVNLPFSFSFYGQCYNQFQVGTNTLLTFQVNPTNLCNTGAGSGFAFTQAIPSAAMNPLWRNSIYFPMQDTNPAVPSTPPVSINYIVDGLAPCRKLIVNVKSMPLFSCGTAQGLQESQLVLYEGTNIIDVHVKRRSVCANWNSGNAVLGLHNANGTQGITPPGRNTGAWVANNESWRFTPSGNSLTTVRWLQGTTVIGTTPSVPVCPTTTTTYTAEVRHNVCGGPRIYTENITVFVNPDDTEPAPSITNCLPNNVFDLTQNEIPVLGPLIASGEYEVYYYTNQSDAQNLASNNIANPSSFTMTSGTSQIIYMSLYNIFSGCVRIQPFSISMIDCALCPTITNPSVTQTLCLGADVNPLAVNTTAVGTNSISYVYFTTPQVGSNMYIGGTPLGNATPNASSVASYDPGILGSPGSFPNVTGTYYVYAIANPTPGLSTCRPYQEIIVNVTSSNGLSLTSLPSTTNQVFCLGNAITPITYTYDPLATATVTGLPNGVNAAIGAGTITISGTPTAITASPQTFTVSVVGSSCGSPTSTGTISVEPITTLVLTSPTATTSQTVCENNAINSITYNFGGSATGVTVTGLPSGVTASTTGNTLTISGTPATSVGSPFNYTVTTTGGNCGTVSLTGTITVNPTTTLVFASATGTDNQTICTNTPITAISYTFAGSATGVTVTGLPAGVTSSISGNTVTISGSPTTTTGSPFNYTVTTTGGNCGAPSLSGVITVQPAATLVLTSAVATSNQTVCNNTAISNIIYTIGGSATGVTVTGLPTGVTFNLFGNTLTISGTPTTTIGSPFIYTITTTGGNCGTPSLTGTITVNPTTTLVLSSAIGTDNQTLCVNSPITPISYTFGGSATSVTASGLPAGITSSISGNTITISGTPTSIVGSPYTITVQTSGGNCGTPTLTALLTIEPVASLTLTSPTATTNQTLCINSPLTNIVYTFGGAPLGVTVTGLPAGVSFNTVGNTLTISGSPTTNVGSPFNYTVTANGGNCGSPSLTGTISVNVGATLVLNSPANLTSQAVCENTAITNIDYTFGGSATGATVTGLPTGVTASISGNTITISGSPTTPSATPYTYSIATSGGTCGAPILTGTITVNPNTTLNLTSASGTANQTLCLNATIAPISYVFAGSATNATLSGLPAGVTYAVTGNTITISGTPSTVTGSPFTYTVTTSGGACGTPSLTGTITVEPLATLVLTSSAASANQTVCINSAIAST